MRIRWKLPLVIAGTTLVFAGIVALASAVILRGVFLERLEDDMARQAREFAAVLTLEASAQTDAGTGTAPTSLQQLTRQAGIAGELRLTVIRRDGTVLADSERDPATLDNHADRTEVKQALSGQEGRARRYSATLGQQEVYVAIPLPQSAASWSEGVVRAALPASRIDAMLAASWRVPLIMWVVLLLPTLAIAYFFARSLTTPLERLRQMTARVAAGDLAYRTSIHRDDELGDLAQSLNTMAEELATRAGELTAEVERSNRILEAMSDGVLLLDADGRLLRCNPAAERILGARLKGMEGSPFVFAARSFPARTLAEKAHKEGKPLKEEVHLPGELVLAVEVVPLVSSGAPQTLFVIRDETARRAVDKMRRDFATNVSHELKTPLAGLSLLAETLASAITEDPQQAEVFVKRLASEIRRLKELTDDLLTLSQLEESPSTGQLALGPLDLAKLANEVAEEVQPLATAKGQTLLRTLPTATPLVGDEVALRTLIRNLLDNAVRYTEPSGHLEIKIHQERRPTGEDWVVLSVRDDGIGIPLADQQRIFERFYRVDKARSRATGGTGLGLSIVRHIAERHGGQVEVQSTVGVGSTFTVRLPSQPPPPSASSI